MAACCTAELVNFLQHPKWLYSDSWLAYSLFKKLYMSWSTIGSFHLRQAVQNAEYPSRTWTILTGATVVNIHTAANTGGDPPETATVDIFCNRLSGVGEGAVDAVYRALLGPDDSCIFSRWVDWILSYDASVKGTFVCFNDVWWTFNGYWEMQDDGVVKWQNRDHRNTWICMCRVWNYSIVSHTPSPIFSLLYNTKFLWAFNFVNFANFQPFAEIFQWKFLTRGVQCVHAANSRNYFNEFFKNCYSWKFRPSKI